MSEEKFFDWKAHGASITISGQANKEMHDKMYQGLKRMQEMCEADTLWQITGIEPEDPEIKAAIIQRREASARYAWEERAKDYWWDQMSEEERQALIDKCQKEEG